MPRPHVSLGLNIVDFRIQLAHYAAFILDLDGNNIDAVYQESKAA